MKLWGLEEKGQPMPVALRTRDDIREWAARRMMPSGNYREIRDASSGHQRSMRLWQEVLFWHPTARIVRVSVNGEPDGR